MPEPPPEDAEEVQVSGSHNPIGEEVDAVGEESGEPAEQWVAFFSVVDGADRLLGALAAGEGGDCVEPGHKRRQQGS